MLLAEIHGKTQEAGRNSEDYLTSATFGHLRYVPPCYFWAEALDLARSTTDGTLAAALARDGTPSISRYPQLTTLFWPHTAYGEPDLVLVFNGGRSPALVVLVEVKLGAEKSGTGERDQLVRYLDLLDDGDALAELKLPDTPHRFVVYLTPRDSLAELRESALLAPGREARLFRLRWQDVRDVAWREKGNAPQPAATILGDVARFLTELGLEHFGGFRDYKALTAFQPERAAFASASPARFRGFIDHGPLAAFAIQKGWWVP